ncbi:NAD(P)/FAD-dependent oxidoreductase [Methanosphaera sp. Vir-13MRS]|uniref:NAD(P)/FAD-dependent oxidoreductase n=1 Tax=Candidatus Methanosphaera massiliense TaxID=3017187 RepID=UPI00238090C5|nr:NAD(P)/FAD-dependent oxidoreductase [Candidatus Methanosphaera massiliense]MDE4077455.1 NAD(P)/FAD-dependent oxidoreductase [Candidatus Methanosphaera massiliense]
MIETDILVVGAGPSGSLAAKEAALHRAKVILIDRKSAIGSPKRCAEGVSKNGLAELGIKPDPRWIARDLKGVRLVAPNGTNVWLDNDTIQLPESGYILERKVFDKHMAMDAARAGATIMIKTNATALERVEDGIIITADHFGEEIKIHAHIVIAADGPESKIGRWAGLESSTAPEYMESCAQYEMAGVEMENNRDIALFFGSVSPGGYAWIFPKGDDIANVGLGVLKTHTDKTAIEHLNEFVKNCPETKNAQPVELNVGGDPVGGIIKDRIGDNILVVGDAGGFVNPLTGGGINSALESGVYAGIVAAQAIQEGDYSKKKFKEYVKLTDENIGKNYKKYDKAKEYLLSLNDDELNDIAKEFEKADFSEVNPRSLIKMLVKVSPKALLKLGKLF